MVTVEALKNRGLVWQSLCFFTSKVECSGQDGADRQRSRLLCLPGGTTLTQIREDPIMDPQMLPTIVLLRVAQRCLLYYHIVR